MEAAQKEKVGVVVIHGVGQTDAGWIDSYLVPELERWAAYASVQALDRKGDSVKDEDKCKLLITATCSDGQHICLGLIDDAHHKTFAEVAAKDAPKLAAKDFSTVKLRLEHLDDLKATVRRVIATQTSEHWLTLLRDQHQIPCAPAFTPLSEVYRVRDPESSQVATTWQSFTRRCHLDDKEVVVSELYWADMSKIGDTSVSRSSAVLKLFLEAPFVLGGAFLKGEQPNIYGLIAWLVSASNWIMRWPIAGLNTPVFLGAGALILQRALEIPESWLPLTVAGVLVAIMLAGALGFRKWVHREVGLADVSLASFTFSFLLLILLAAARFFAPMSILESTQHYIAFGIHLLLLAWTVWTIAIVLAAVLVCLAAVYQAVSGIRTPPLARPAAAISLNLLLGMVWKLILPVLGILLVNLLASATAMPQNCKSKFSWFDAPFDVAKDPACSLWTAQQTLIDIAILNGLAILVVGAVTVLVLAARKLTAMILERRLPEVPVPQKAGSQPTLPRMIASPFIVLTLFAAAMINAAVYFSNEDLLAPIRGLLPYSTVTSVSVSAIALVVLFYVLQRIIERSSSVVHVGRDLVDHQYGGERRTLSRLLVPEALRRNSPHAEHDHALEEAAVAVASLASGQSRPPTTEFRPFRRRQRILRRLIALLDEVIADLRVDRLILLAHSQGTVILHDYLVDKDKLIPKEHLVSRAHDGRQRLSRVDVMTLGSPLSHIYGHYFDDYKNTVGESKEVNLIAKVATWTNMWRIDDPIGQLVDAHPAIENIVLRHGGHQYYWKENEVCQRLWGLILNPPAIAERLVSRAGYSISTGKSLAEADLPAMPSGGVGNFQRGRS